MGDGACLWVWFAGMVLGIVVDTLAVLVAWAGSHLDGVDQAVLAEGGSGSSITTVRVGVSTWYLRWLGSASEILPLFPQCSLSLVFISTGSPGLSACFTLHL